MSETTSHHPILSAQHLYGGHDANGNPRCGWVLTEVSIIATAGVPVADTRTVGWLEQGYEGSEPLRRLTRAGYVVLEPASVTATGATIREWRKESKRMDVSQRGGIGILDTAAAGSPLAPWMPAPTKPYGER